MKKYLVLLIIFLTACVPINQLLTTPNPLCHNGFISGFSSMTDAHWTLDSLVFGNHNANLTSNNGWSVNQIDGCTLRYEVRSGDKWDGDISSGNIAERSESWIYGTSLFFPTKTLLTVDYKFMVEPGALHPTGNNTWILLGQIHGNDSASPPVAVELSGEYLQIYGRWGTISSYTTQKLWKNLVPIQRGQWYHMRFETNNDNTSNGFLRAWLDGTQIVNYMGAIGYNDTMKWSQGLYRYPASYTMAVQFRNVAINKLVILQTLTPTTTKTATPTSTFIPIPLTQTPTPISTNLCVLDVWSKTLNSRPSASMFNIANYGINFSRGAIIPIEEVIVNSEGTWAKLNWGQYFAMYLKSNNKTYAIPTSCP